MAKNTAAVDTTEMGVHPYKNTHNMALTTAGYSLVFHGGINFFNGDYPTDGGRFNTLGYPSAGIALEYNFTPVWGIGLGYNFAMPQVTAKKEIGGRDVDGVNSYTIKAGDVMHRAMMHSGQVYVTFNLVNAWFPRAVRDIFGLGIFAGVGSTWYKNSVSFHDTGDLNAEGKVSDAGKYVKDGDDAHAHSKYAQVTYVPIGALAEFNVSRQVALGVRFQYDMYFNDYVDNRYQDKANKNNDGMYELELMLRWKLAAKSKNHVRNVASVEVLEEKIYESHPHRRPRRPHEVDTLFIYQKDTIVIIHRDTIVVNSAPTIVQPTEQPAQLEPAGRCDLTLYPGWEAEADAVVVEGQSLSQLARKYYKNTFCWVYLWIANRSIAPDPNLIMPKCVLKVPRLNACQLSITKQEAKDMCASYRGE